MPQPRGAALALIPLLALGCASSTPEESSIVQAFSTDAEGIALKGYDPVSYFSEHGPTLGTPAISAEWRDATFRFASEEHRARFEADPERFAPQFGGHCAFGLSMNQAAAADPTAWTLHDGKLYLNASPAVRFVWRWMPGVVGRAERNWQRLQTQS